MKKEKTSKQLERHLKGIANHRRIEILLLLGKNESMTLDSISEYLDCHIATVSEHTARLDRAGLVNKTYKGRYVLHSLSPYGKVFLEFLGSFSRINR
jgi:DNA-binding transcriptional ArsR family regulator